MDLSYIDLSRSIRILKAEGVKIRFNCNCIKGHIDSHEEIHRYVRWAKGLGADSVRFAELKLDFDSFVDIAKILGYKYGLNDDPFTYGCNKTAVIEGLPIDFRQMCGLQTSHRPRPTNPEQDNEKTVLYYNGIIYDGWQSARGTQTLNKKELKALLEDVVAGIISTEEAANIIEKENKQKTDESQSFGCRY